MRILFNYAAETIVVSMMNTWTPGSKWWVNSSDKLIKI